MSKRYLVKPYTMNWNNEESDSLHLEYSYDGSMWYALNGGNGVLFPTAGSKRMTAPVLVKSDNGYTLYAADACDAGKVFVYTSQDLIHYEEAGYVDAAAVSYAAAEYVEVTKEVLEGLQAVYGKPEPVTIVGTEDLALTMTADNITLPDKVQVTYSNGGVEAEKVYWEDAEQLKAGAGTYTVHGYVTHKHYANPLIFHRADPFIYKHTDGTYYFTASHTDAEHNLVGEYQYRHIYLRHAATLEDLADDSGKYEEVSVFDRDPLPERQSPHIWAPEIHYIRGKWYIYYTTTVNDNDIWQLRPHVLECADADPMTGTWINQGPVKTTTTDSIAFTEFSLDHSVLQLKDELYLFWAEKHPHPTNSNIYVAKMTDPLTIDSSRVTMIVEPVLNWERHGFPVCEGPGFIRRNGKIFMTYSASGTDALYCNGLLTIDEDADLLEASNWKKSPFPVFQSSRENGQFGPGHNSFTFDEEGHDIFVYHARQEERYLVDEGYEPLYDAGRNASLVRLYWNPDGTPNFSVPMPCGKGYTEKIPVTAEITVK